MNLTLPASRAETFSGRSPASGVNTVRLGKREVVPGSRGLGWLKPLSLATESVEVLRARLLEDGYLLLRGVVPTATVTAARRVVLEHLAAQGLVDTARPLMEGGMAVDANGATGAYLGGVEAVTHHPDFLGLVEGPALVGTVEQVLGEASITPRYKWLRAVGSGDGTSPHYDVVFMGRGTRQRLFTCWTPLGDIGIDNGPLALLAGSHNLDSYQKVRETYGKADVDVDNIDSNFSHDPLEISERYGAQWQTAEFKAGDVLLFGMYTMHAALSNATDRLRLSCDVRFQPASEPIDPRWFGDKPVGNYGWKKIGPVVPVEVSRKAWGV